MVKSILKNVISETTPYEGVVIEKAGEETIDIVLYKKIGKLYKIQDILYEEMNIFDVLVEEDLTGFNKRIRNLISEYNNSYGTKVPKTYKIRESVFRESIIYY